MTEPFFFPDVDRDLVPKKKAIRKYIIIKILIKMEIVAFNME